MNGIISGLSGERPGSSTVAPWDQDIKTHEQSDALFWILSLPKQAFGFRLLERNLILIFDDSLACKLCSKTDSLISWKSCWRTLTDYILLMTSENKPEIVEGWKQVAPMFLPISTRNPLWFLHVASFLQRLRQASGHPMRCAYSQRWGCGCPVRTPQLWHFLQGLPCMW